MSSVTDNLMVFLNDRLMGRVFRERGRKLSFRYDDAYGRDEDAVPISLSMPLVEEAHSDDKIHPFLWGLLPDSDSILRRWAQRFQVSPSDCFGLLKEMGADCAGALRFIDPENADRANQGGRRLVKDKEIEKRLADLRRDPALGRSPEDRGQFSLAGAQAKTAFQRRGGNWYLPWGTEPTTHIFKLPRPDLDGQAENEHFCLRLGESLGLRTVKSEILHFGNEAAIVIERYDRVISNRKWLRVHQEDACQALAIHPANKYESDGGPGIEAIVALLNRSSRPVEDRRRFLEAIAFNYLILGSDAHAKNYSLLLGVGGQVRMAPLYDLASLLPYANRRRDLRFAMKIGRSYRDDRIRPKHFERLARRCDFPPAELFDLIVSMAEQMPGTAERVIREMNSHQTAHSTLDDILEKLESRCARIVSSF